MKNEGIRYHHYDSAEIKLYDYVGILITGIAVEVDTT